MRKIKLSEVDKLLEQLSAIIDEIIEQVQSHPVDSESHIQLREISKAIERLEFAEITIPSALLEEKSRLLSTVRNNREYQDEAMILYNKLNALILRLRDVGIPWNRANLEGHVTTPWQIIAKTVIDTLRQQKMKVRRSEVRKAVFVVISERKLPGDMEPARHNGKPFWENTVERVLYNLRKDNILKPSIKHGIYELEEVYYENQTPFD